MTPAVGRRELLRLGLGAAGAAQPLSRSLARALAIPASHRSGSIMDVEHVVILMQENRSFDHYFGTLAGVRGFADPHPAPLGDSSVWRQPDGAGGVVTPFRFDVERTSFPVMKSLHHDFQSGHAAWNDGRYDRWIAAKGSLTMGYLRREDIAHHYALADAFTVCDAYFSSMHGPTCPNRLFMMTGGNDPQGLGGGPVIDCDNVTQVPDGRKIYGPGWRTYAEQLQDAGVRWQAYRQGADPWSDDDSDGGMNPLLAFRTFIDAKPGDPLYERGVRPRRLEQLKADVVRGELAQVSWIFPPRLFCEHPKWPPAYGVEYIARVMDALTANPEVWSKTAFFLMYDENDGFFDHVVPPMPPLSNQDGLSTVSTAAERHAPTGQPYGLGPRVPMLVISPWSRGGWVCSQVFDHTSLLRFIEARFGVRAENITPWRRAVCGDLTSAFDFKTPNRDPVAGPSRIDAAIALPSERQFQLYRAACAAKPKPTAAPEPTPPEVEPGSRPARALPYALAVEERLDGGRLRLELINTGTAGAAVHVYDRRRPDAAPRRYTVEAGKRLADLWPAADGYHLLLHGPNGFVRAYKGEADPGLALQVGFTPSAATLELTAVNRTRTAQRLHVTDQYSGRTDTHTLAPGARRSKLYDLRQTSFWYDVLVLGDGFERRLAGRLETGRPGVSDPAMAARAQPPGNQVSQT